MSDIKFLTDSTDNYEMDTKGVYPINCSQCKENKKWYKFAESYGLRTEADGTIKCVSLTGLSGYYRNTTYKIYE